MLRASIEAYFHCECGQIEYWCPTCGLPDTRVAPPSKRFVPSTTQAICEDCGTVITIKVVGYQPNPTGETPATNSPLSEALPGLTKAFAAPAAKQINKGRTPRVEKPVNQFDIPGFVWQRVLHAIELPSTRMLLRMQAQLVLTDDEPPTVLVQDNWLSMVQSRQAFIKKAAKDCGYDFDHMLLVKKSEHGKPAKPVTRHRLRHWIDRRALADTNGAAVSAAYRRLFGKEAEKQGSYVVYSAEEIKGLSRIFPYQLRSEDLF